MIFTEKGRYAVHSKLDYRSFALLLATGNHAALDGKAAAPEQPRPHVVRYFAKFGMNKVAGSFPPRATRH